MRAQKQKAMVDPITSAIITVSHKGIARIDFCDVEKELSRAKLTASFSFPNAAPFDARRSPFSGTACVSQASGPSQLIPCIRPQTREIASVHSNPQTQGHCFLSTFVRH